jgi:hypothetical protein
MANNNAQPVLCLDVIDTAHFLWTVAYARALQQTTQLVWVPYRDSSVLNGIYAVMGKFGYGAPGTVEVSTNQIRLEQLTDQFFDSTIDAFFNKATDATHPMHLGKWMDGLVETRRYSLEAVQSVFADATDINREIMTTTATGIKRLAAIHLASTVALSAMSCGIGLAGSGVAITVSGGIQTGYGIAGEVIKGWEKADRAKAISIGLAKEGGKKVLEEGADKAAETGLEASTKWAIAYRPKILAAMRKIDKYSAEVAQKVRTTAGRPTPGKKLVIASRRLETATAEKAVALGGARTAIRVTKTVRALGKAIPIIFAVWDVVEALQDYHEETEGTETE